MKALTYQGSHDVQVIDVPDPTIQDPKDVIIKITSTAICGSDLHIFGGFIPTMEKNDVLGHEFMGEIVEVGSEVKDLKKGDRIIVPFTIACRDCFFCDRGMFSLCDKTNPNHKMAEEVYGYSPAGLYGYSHMFGGYAGGQAEYARVPFAETSVFKVPDGLADEQVLFLTDIFPTGWMAAENARVQAGDTVAVWGAGPVGQFAIRSAFMMGAARVIVIDRFAERLAMAKIAGADTLNYDETEDVFEALKSMTSGRGPDCCIDAVGLEAHGEGLSNAYDKVKQTLMLESDRPYVLRQIIRACRKGGTVSIAGVYGGFADKFPIGIAFNKGLTFAMGQTHVQKYVPQLLEKVQKGEIDPSFVITHRRKLDEAAEMYRLFKEKEDGCIKVVLTP